MSWRSEQLYFMTYFMQRSVPDLIKVNEFFLKEAEETLKVGFFRKIEQTKVNEDLEKRY